MASLALGNSLHGYHAISFFGLEEEARLSSRDVSLGFAGHNDRIKTPKIFQKNRQRQGPQWLKGYKGLRILGENPALVVVKQWRRPAAAAFCAGCARGSSSPERDARLLC